MKRYIAGFSTYDDATSCLAHVVGAFQRSGHPVLVAGVRPVGGVLPAWAKGVLIRVAVVAVAAAVGYLLAPWGAAGLGAGLGALVAVCILLGFSWESPALTQAEVRALRSRTTVRYAVVVKAA